jgi:dUTP pyrophosphatase
MVFTLYPVVPFKKVNPDAPTPQYAKKGDAGMDLCTMEEVEIAPQGTVMVGSGIAMAIPDGYEGEVRPRSGMAAHRGITIANTPGTIDSGYRGEIMLPLYNLGHETAVVEKGERVAQILIHPVCEATMTEVDDLSETERGADGFGSTGTKYPRP